MDFSAASWVAIAAVAVIGIAVFAFVISRATASRSKRRQHTSNLRGSFGSEYDATIDRHGRKDGEAQLDERSRKYDPLELDRIKPSGRDDLTNQWKDVQFRFLEDPSYSVREAEHIIDSVMRLRGYPSESFDSRVQSLSVTDSELAQPYRAAYETFRASEDGTASVLEMFDAMASYRTLFETLLERPQREASVEESGPPAEASVFESTP